MPALMDDPARAQPPRPSSWTFLLLLAATAVATSAHGAAMPFLPGLIAQAEGGLETGDHRRHVAYLAAAFPLAVLLSAPLWGLLSDKIGPRIVLLIGLAGFALSAARFGTGNLQDLYVLRMLNGGFSAAVVPVAFAYAAARAVDEEQKIRRFTWLNACFFVGELSGPLLGELSAALALPAPLTIPAFAMGVIAAVLLARSIFEVEPLGLGAEPMKARPPGHGRLIWVLLIAAVGSAGLSSLHVVLLLQEQPGHLSRQTVSYLLSLCGFAMLAAQVTPWHTRWIAGHARRAIRPMLLTLVAALVTVSFLPGHWLLIIVIVAAGWAAATLRLVTSLLCAGAERRIVGIRLGLQHASISAGQIAASAGIGVLEAGSENFTLWAAAGAALLLSLTAPFLLRR